MKHSIATSTEACLKAIRLGGRYVKFSSGWHGPSSEEAEAFLKHHYPNVGGCESQYEWVFVGNAGGVIDRKASAVISG